MEDIKQPYIDMQRMKDELINATPEEVEFCGKTIKIGWLHNRTIRKFSHIMVTEEDPIKKNVKLCTIVLLNNVFKIFFLYWILWRWYYYVKDLDSVEILKVLDVAKKKVPQKPFLIVTILATGMTDLMMMMTKKEALHFQAEQHGEPHSA